MSRLFILALAWSALFAGCASKPQSSSRIYEGDGPNIKYLEEREMAGGPVGSGR